MEQKLQNPLAKHFRQPAIYMKLPSGGRYWPEGSLELPVTGEIPVYPMTARDEITVRTPDALLNGQGVVDVLQSCCPNIKNAWDMPTCDVDAVLLSIRIASYGNGMDFDTECPSCKEENEYTMDISTLIGKIVMPSYDTPLLLDGLSILLKPQAYLELNRVNQLNFTEQQILRTIEDDSLSDAEKKQITDNFVKKLLDINIGISCNSTASITTEDGTVVTDKAFIEEFYNSADYKIVKAIQERIKQINMESAIAPVDVECKHCSHKFQLPMEFDYANFFDLGF